MSIQRERPTLSPVVCLRKSHHHFSLKALSTRDDTSDMGPWGVSEGLR